MLLLKNVVVVLESVSEAQVEVNWVHGERHGVEVGLEYVFERVGQVAEQREVLVGVP